MTKNLKKDESYEVIYDGTGSQEEIIFDISNGYLLGGTVRIIGGSLDVFTLQSKIGDSWGDLLDSSDGKIPDITIIGKAKGIKLNIATNNSGAIKLEIIL